MTSSNLVKTKVEEDEVATTDPIESKEEQLEYNQGHDAVEGGNKVDSPEKQPKQKGGEGDGAPSSPSNQDQSTTVPPTPANPNTPGQHSASTATTATPGPLTPAVQQIPIQPYARKSLGGSRLCLVICSMKYFEGPSSKFLIRSVKHCSAVSQSLL